VAARGTTRGRCRLHADALMTNPIHLLPTPEQAERAPRVPISVGRRDVQSVNHTDGRTGTLWDGRYTSSLVDVPADMQADLVEMT
jgi:hypothetical protein